MNRLSKLVVSVVVVGLVLSWTYVSAFGATITDWPEANPFPAFKAGKEQRIWHRPGNVVLESLSGPIIRFTATIYNEPTKGFITLTHTGPNGPVTFYYNVKAEEDYLSRQVILSLDASSGMWKEGFLGLVPATSAPTKDILTDLPAPARMLWVLPPVQAYITKEKGGNHTLSLILGGPDLNGLVTLPLDVLETFEDVQNGRQVKIWGAEVLSLTSVKWEGKNDDGKLGMYSWEPGWNEPVFQQDATWM